MNDINACAQAIKMTQEFAARGDCRSANYYADLAMKVRRTPFLSLGLSRPSRAYACAFYALSRFQTASESVELIVVKARCALESKDYHAAIAETR